MRESDTYQMILEEGVERGRSRGRLEGALEALLLVGSPRLGEPDPAARERILGETDPALVEEWLRHATRVESWSDLPGFVR